MWSFIQRLSIKDPRDISNAAIIKAKMTSGLSTYLAIWPNHPIILVKESLKRSIAYSCIPLKTPFRSGHNKSNSGN